MKKSILTLSVVALLGLSACEKATYKQNSEMIKQDFEVMKSGDETAYLRDNIYKENLQALLPLVDFINRKQQSNTKNEHTSRPHLFSYAFNEASLQDIVNVLRPFEGYYSKRTCPQLKDDEYVFLSPEAFAYYALEHSAIDKKSLKAQRIYVDFVDKANEIATYNVIQEVVEKSLAKAGQTLPNEPNARKDALRYVVWQYFNMDMPSIFFDPRVIYCKDFNYKQLKGLKALFTQFDRVYKPLDFNEQLADHGYYDEHYYSDRKVDKGIKGVKTQ